VAAVIGAQLRRIPAVRAAVREGRFWRRRAAERLGSERYSRPAADGMDRQLEAHLPPGPGVFIEAGAHDGYTQSNTYWLERFRGWSGLLVEPLPEMARRARRNRPRSTVVECALVAPDEAGTPITVRYGNTSSVVVGARGSAEADAEWITPGLARAGQKSYDVTVPGRTLSDVLDELGITRVDLLSLDLEGYELPALEGLDLDRHAPTLMLVEITQGDEQREAIHARLSGHYDFVAQLSVRDHLFRAR
jgi:FkbM family methyltransferase